MAWNPSKTVKKTIDKAAKSVSTELGNGATAAFGRQTGEHVRSAASNLTKNVLGVMTLGVAEFAPLQRPKRPVFTFQRNPVERAMSSIAREKRNIENLLVQMQSIAARVPQAWIGDDANQFTADFARRIVPAMAELAAAIAGVNLNLTKATGVVDSTDTSNYAQVANLGNTFRNIF